MQVGGRPRSSAGWVFVLITLSSILFGYYEFLRTTFPLAEGGNAKERRFAWTGLSTVTLALAMQLWALGKVVGSRPGDVPPFWGFSMSDATITRRRYCLMCHVFKPERAHHCSLCNRCVLHMDHHCPWVNNCIGFLNRKFFLLLLFYSLLLLYAQLGFTAGIVRNTLEGLGKKGGWSREEMERGMRLVGVYALETVLAVVLTLFFKYHIGMALRGTTTIEEMERAGKRSEFDLGIRRNWGIVFGSNPLLWLFPIHCTSGKPMGDGITWEKAVDQQEKAYNRSDTPKDGQKKVDFDAQQDALLQLRHVIRGPAEQPSKLDTSPHDESELRGLNVHSGNTSSFLSQSFKF